MASTPLVDVVSKWSIATKELIPVVLASMPWGSRWHGCLVMAQAVVEVISVGYSKDPLLMQLLHYLFSVLVQYEFSFSNSHSREIECRG